MLARWGAKILAATGSLPSGASSPTGSSQPQSPQLQSPQQQHQQQQHQQQQLIRRPSRPRKLLQLREETAALSYSKESFERILTEQDLFDEFKNYALNVDLCIENIKLWEAVVELEDLLCEVDPTYGHGLESAQTWALTRYLNKPVAALAPVMPVPHELVAHFLYFHANFLAQGAAMEVNITGATRKAISAAIFDGERSPTGLFQSNVFDKAIDEVLGLLYLNTFKGFIKDSEKKIAAAATAAADHTATVDSSINFAQLTPDEAFAALAKSIPPSVSPTPSLSNAFNKAAAMFGRRASVTIVSSDTHYIEMMREAQRSPMPPPIVGRDSLDSKKSTLSPPPQPPGFFFMPSSPSPNTAPKTTISVLPRAPSPLPPTPAAIAPPKSLPLTPLTSSRSPEPAKRPPIPTRRSSDTAISPHSAIDTLDLSFQLSFTTAPSYKTQQQQASSEDIKISKRSDSLPMQATSPQVVIYPTNTNPPYPRSMPPPRIDTVSVVNSPPPAPPPKDMFVSGANVPNILFPGERTTSKLLPPMSPRAGVASPRITDTSVRTSPRTTSTSSPTTGGAKIAPSRKSHIVYSGGGGGGGSGRIVTGPRGSSANAGVVATAGSPSPVMRRPATAMGNVIVVGNGMYTRSGSVGESSS